MAGTQDKRQKPGKSREQQRPQRPGLDPVHPEPGGPSRSENPGEPGRRRGDDPLHEETDLRDSGF